MRADWKEEREGFERRERGSMFQVDGPWTEKEREPKELSLERGVQRQRGSEAERRERAGVYSWSELER